MRSAPGLLAFVSEQLVGTSIHEVQLAASGTIHDDVRIARTIRIVVDPALDVFSGDGTSEHVVGHACTLLPDGVVAMRQINVLTASGGARRWRGAGFDWFCFSL